MRVFEKSGRSTLSQVVKLADNDPEENRLWPNPATEKVFITLTMPEKSNATASILNVFNSFVCNKSILIQNGVTILASPSMTCPEDIFN